MVRIESIGKEQLFQINEINIVTPEEIEWLENTDQAVLTLITCYPFEYIGEAPKRYIIRAKLILEESC